MEQASTSTRTTNTATHSQKQQARYSDQPDTHLLLVFQAVQGRSSPPWLLLLWWGLLCSSSSLLHRWSLSSNIQPVTAILPFFFCSFLFSLLPRCPPSPKTRSPSTVLPAGTDTRSLPGCYLSHEPCPGHLVHAPPPPFLRPTASLTVPSPLSSTQFLLLA